MGAAFGSQPTQLFILPLGMVDKWVPSLGWGTYLFIITPVPLILKGPGVTSGSFSGAPAAQGYATLNSRDRVDSFEGRSSLVRLYLLCQLTLIQPLQR